MPKGVAMEKKSIWEDFSNLPPEAQREARDFIAFLRSRYSDTPRGKKTRRIPLSKESFIGIWKDRGDLKESSTWVRNCRRAEWGERHA